MIVRTKPNINGICENSAHNEGCVEVVEVQIALQMPGLFQNAAAIHFEIFFSTSALTHH